MTEERIFNHRRRWLLRTRIGNGEMAASVLVLGALALMVGWVLAQRGNFNPAERDLPFEVLAASPVEDRLYRTPLKLWVTPGGAQDNTAPGGGPAGPSLGVFPPSLLSGGWALSGRPRQFTPDTLFEKINGEAEKFIRLGFQRLHYVAVRHTSGAELSIELFDQGGFEGALGIFSAHRSGNQPVREEGAARYYTTPVGAVGFSGPWFFRMAADRETPPVGAKALELVRAFAQLGAEGEPATQPATQTSTPRAAQPAPRSPAPSPAKPLPYRVFTGAMGLPPTALDFQQANVFQYGFASGFWFAGAGDATKARYFLHQAPSAMAARETFAAISREHETIHEVLRRAEDTLVMRHKYLNTLFAMEQRGALLLGVEDAPDEQAVKRMMAGLSSAVKETTQGGDAK